VELLSSFIPKLRFEDTRDFGSRLRVTPVYWDTSPTPDERYYSLDEAFLAGAIEVSETDNAGTVREVQVSNIGNRPIILFDGDGLRGAKQNRILEHTVVVPTGASLLVPVNCVERGRWNYTTDKFAAADYKATPRMKQVKMSLKKQGFEHQVQSEVWATVSACSANLSVSSISEDLGEIMQRAKLSSEPLRSFLAETRCQGFLIQGAGKPFIELYPTSTMAKNWALKSYSGWLADARRSEITRMPLEYMIETLKHTLWAPTVGTGAETAFQSADVHDGRITYHDGDLVHLYCSLTLD